MNTHGSQSDNTSSQRNYRPQHEDSGGKRTQSGGWANLFYLEAKLTHQTLKNELLKFVIISNVHCCAGLWEESVVVVEVTKNWGNKEKEKVDLTKDLYVFNKANPVLIRWFVCCLPAGFLTLSKVTSDHLVDFVLWDPFPSLMQVISSKTHTLCTDHHHLPSLHLRYTLAVFQQRNR